MRLMTVGSSCNALDELEAAEVVSGNPVNASAVRSFALGWAYVST
jgi:hypothetical protein